MPEETQQAKIVIDGREYPFPDFDSLTMDEADTLYGYTKVALDKIEFDGFNPRLIMAMTHIAIARVRTDLDAREIEERVRKLGVAEMNEAFKGSDEQKKTNPLASANEPTSSETDDEPAPSGGISDVITGAVRANDLPRSFGSLGSGIG